MNVHAIAAIYKFEMNRTLRTLWQSVVSPVISTSLYFVVFGAAMAASMRQMPGVGGNYGAFIVPGLIMMTLFTQSIFNASFAIFFPKFIGTIYELLSAPVSFVEIIIAYVGAAATKSVALGLIILATARLMMPFNIEHPFWMIAFLVITALSFSLFGFIIGVLSAGFEEIQFIPMLIVTPLTFLGGAFYPIKILPPIWQLISKFNPIVYLISGYRWSFGVGEADVPVGLSLAFMFGFFAICLTVVAWIFKTGYRIKV